MRDECGGWAGKMIMIMIMIMIINFIIKKSKKFDIQKLTPCQNKLTIPKKFSLVFKILHSVRYPTRRCSGGEMGKDRQPGISETF